MQPRAFTLVLDLLANSMQVLVSQRVLHVDGIVLWRESLELTIFQLCMIKHNE